jgi:hypothetical protein
MKERKSFFSEEKKQKTFISALAARSRHWPPAWEQLKETKVFWFFFSKKNAFLKPSPRSSFARSSSTHSP